MSFIGYERKTKVKKKNVSVALLSALTSLELVVLSNLAYMFMNCKNITLCDVFLGRNIPPQQEEAVPCISVLFSDDTT